MFLSGLTSQGDCTSPAQVLFWVHFPHYLLGTYNPVLPTSTPLPGPQTLMTYRHYCEWGYRHWPGNWALSRFKQKDTSVIYMNIYQYQWINWYEKTETDNIFMLLFFLKLSTKFRSTCWLLDWVAWHLKLPTSGKLAKATAVWINTHNPLMTCTLGAEGVQSGQCVGPSTHVNNGICIYTHTATASGNLSLICMCDPP